MCSLEHKVTITHRLSSHNTTMQILHNVSTTHTVHTPTNALFIKLVKV